VKGGSNDQNNVDSNLHGNDTDTLSLDSYEKGSNSVPSPLAGAGLAKQEGEGYAVLPPSTLPFKVISNLPYNVGTAIIQQILPLPNWTTAVFMLQKEVIARLAAKPDGKEYGYISIFTQYYADAKILFDVSPTCFNPRPEVTSSVIKLTNKKPKNQNKNFFPLVKHSFSMRRKTMLNCLGTFAQLDKIAAAKILEITGIDPMLRPDKLSISDFENLANNIIS
jgi:16S rRNA (adenine1518-N6/adenine1519-N6)-dimethyltransferase